MAAAQDQYDVLVIGSGCAGLGLALRLSERHQVAVLSKTGLTESNTFYAQGGVSAVTDKLDSVEAHVTDTLQAGAGLCDPEIVRFVVEQGTECVRWLMDQGVDFTRATSGESETGLHLTREGGHSHRRVLHVADATGRAIENVLADAARNRLNITLLEEHLAVDLISGDKFGGGPWRCHGAYVYDRRAGRVKVIRAKVVVLASGGAGKVYLYTSNPDVATGDGIAMAWRSGCRVANLEFIQFHPTCLYHPDAKSFLISEALRGEGATLRLEDGSRFLHRFDAREELAPRDIVARAIDHEMKRLGAECVYLDISHQPAEFILTHFPTVHERCQAFGYDLTKEAIPVVPAAHYTCGGVMTNRWGEADLPGLFAIGEVAFTGLHGANRMASNSLLECLVFAKSASERIEECLDRSSPSGSLPEWDESRVTDSDEEVVVSHNWDELRRFMWDYVGIVRTTKRLQRAKHRVDLLIAEIEEYYGDFKITNDLIELRNLSTVADLIIQSALRRTESRGLHFTLDHLDPAAVAVNTILSPRD